MNELYEQLKSLNERATPGPWRTVDNNWSTTGIYADDPRVAKDWRIGEITIEQEATEENQDDLAVIADANAELIATLRNALPELLQMMQRLREDYDTIPLDTYCRHNVGDLCDCDYHHKRREFKQRYFSSTAAPILESKGVNP